MEKALKWGAIVVVAVIVIAIAFGYRGGAKEATTNYHSIMTGK